MDQRIDPSRCYGPLCAKLCLMVCNQITARGASPGVGLSPVIKFNNCFRQTRHNYLKMLNKVSNRWAEDVKRSYCMITQHLSIMCSCWAISFVVSSYSWPTAILLLGGQTVAALYNDNIILDFSAIQLQKGTVQGCSSFYFSTYSCCWPLKFCSCKSCLM